MVSLPFGGSYKSTATDEDRAKFTPESEQRDLAATDAAHDKADRLAEARERRQREREERRKNRDDG